MADFLTPSTSADAAAQAATVAVLPVGSLEQNGDFLPLATER
jgi:creatinine amidohydrolase